MAPSDFTTTLLIDQPPAAAFDLINDVTRWWTENLEGSARHLNDTFTVHFPGIHVSTQRVVEQVPAQKIVWLVVDSNLNNFADKQEWTGTTIEFNITRKGNKTQLRFTHVGLTPDVECYHSCTRGWAYYVDVSLVNLFTTGKGQPSQSKSRSES